MELAAAQAAAAVDAEDASKELKKCRASIASLEAALADRNKVNADMQVRKWNVDIRHG